MPRHTISNSDDIIDSRDVIARISDLESELEDAYNEDRDTCGTCDGTGEVSAQSDGDVEGEDTSVACEDCNGEGGTAPSISFEDWLTKQVKDDTTHADDANELQCLRALAEECERYGDWRHGERLIRDSYFEDYARDLADDLHGRGVRDASWPFNYIDWEAAADALKADYMSVEFDGETYWMRS